MSISIVIPSYNGIEVVKKNLPKIFDVLGRQKIEKKELIVIDDKSTDGSYEFLKSFKDEHSNADIKIKLGQNNKNLGFSSTVNSGVKIAGGEIVILLNTDVNPQADFIEPLLSHFKDPGVFAVGCMDESLENGSVVLRGRGVGMWQRGFLVHSAGSLDKGDTLWVSGGSGAFRRSIWEDLGGLEELYNPFYWEDIDLSYRAIKSGYKVVFEKKSIVRHEHEKGTIKRHFSSSKVRKTSYRNQISFVWLNITDIEYILLHIFWLPYHLLTRLLRGDYFFVWGLFLALLRLPKIIYKRNIRKRMFKITDREVLLPFSTPNSK